MKDPLRATWALRQYALAAGMMRIEYDRAAERLADPIPVSDMLLPAGGRDIDPAFVFLRHWYASLHVVVEGWRRLALQDAWIDASLQDLEERNETEVLKLFRHSVYHFHGDPVDPRITDLLVRGLANGARRRLVKLQHQFDGYFDRWARDTDLSSLATFPIKRRRT